MTDTKLMMICNKLSYTKALIQNCILPRAGHDASNNAMNSHLSLCISCVQLNMINSMQGVRTQHDLKTT